MVEVRDTSQDYDDLVGYKAKENVKTNLDTFISGKVENEPPEIDKPDINPDFPEDWQKLFVNFRCKEDYIEFMKKMDEAALPKLRSFVYKKDKDNGLLNFF
jgi:hypothetical protein